METLNELEAYFKDADVPDTLKIGRHATIIDVTKYIDSHLTVARINENVSAFSTYRLRLIALKAMLEERQATESIPATANLRPDKD